MKKSVLLTIGILVGIIWALVGIPSSLISNLQTATANSNVIRSHSRQTAALTFEQRLAYQWALEEVYWRHKIWPNENQQPKPRLEEVMPLAKVRANVEDALLKSEALARFYKQPITSEQLQAEIERMARQTRQSELLTELWAALDNDAYVVAEVLARPLLADRLLRNWYSTDEQFHGALKTKAETEINSFQSPSRMKQASGRYIETEWAKVEQKSSAESKATRAGSALAIELNPSEWSEALANLSRVFENSKASMRRPPCLTCPASTLEPAAGLEDEILPVDSVSALQEDRNRFYVTAVILKTPSRMRTATVEWHKMDFDKWWTETKDSLAISTQPSQFTYQLPAITQTTCTDDTWKPTLALSAGVYAPSVVWTGTEMMVWGGVSTAGGGVNLGARYNPATDTWTAMGVTDAPRRRVSHTAVWTGTEMIVWGGCDTSGHLCGLFTGGRYNPTTDTWTHTTTANAPSSRRNHTAVWTGSRMIIWGGCSPSFDGRCPTLNTGGVYDPLTNSWTATSLVNVPTPRSSHTAVWSGNVMIIWGATADASGGRYNPTTNTWAPTSTINLPSGRGNHTAIWTGTEMMVWGGAANNSAVNTGGRYNPVSDVWMPISMASAPAARYYHSAVWTGAEMIIWGGWPSGAGSLNTGGRYNPVTNSWTATSTTNAPSPRAGHVAVWTGSLMVVWGGVADKSGGRYNPATDNWTPTNANNTVEARERPSAVWTGTEMIVWGGEGQLLGTLNSGGRYRPSTDSWQPTNTADAPYGRVFAAVVWSGTEMLVWGGQYGSTCFGDGGRYNPTTDTWASITAVGAPSERSNHTGVWTGAEMIIWGGGCGDTLSTGARYNPATNSWQPTNLANAPGGRYLHTAVWTGTEMIIWGGSEFGTGVTLNTGGRYNPATNSWQLTTTANAPSARIGHTAIWSGSDMIIWGGWLYVSTGPSTYYNTGGRYNPATNSWQATSNTNAPAARTWHTAVWTGSLMIVWGGVAGQSSLSPTYASGGRYNPATDAWTPTDVSGAPSARYNHSAIWTGTEMIVWAGYSQAMRTYTAQGGRYCASLDPGFNLSISPASLTVPMRTSAATTLALASLNGFSDAVSLSAVGVPAGVTVGFSANPVTPSANATINVPVTISVSSAVTYGTYTFLVVGTSGSLTRRFLVEIQIPPAPDFYVTCYPSQISALQGASVTTEDRAWGLDGFNGAVTMSCAGLPAGVTYSFLFSQLFPPSGGSQTDNLTLNVGASVPPGVYNFQLVGTWSDLVRTYPMQLSVMPADCSYVLTPTYSDTFTAAGGTSSVTVTTSPGCNWQAVSNADWITITSGASGTGTGVVNYTVAPNPNAGARLVRMTIAGQTYQIYQTGAPCPFIITPSSHAFTAQGWTGMISVNVPGLCNWTATTTESWITITTVSVTTDGGTVTYSVAPNTAATARTGTINIGGQAFMVMQGAAFLDVPPTHPFYNEIGRLSARGVTLGTGAGNFSPEQVVSREQMSVFIERALGIFNPPHRTTQTFADVAPSRWSFNFIEDFASRGITVGCGGGNYCPDGQVTREQMAMFIIRALGQPNPPMPAGQRFADVVLTRMGYAFIEEMAVRQITLGCGGGNYCPDQGVTRAQMAAFLARAFGL